MIQYRTPLDSFDKLPEEMIIYLQHNGYHFNKKACEWAVSKMRKLNTATNKLERIESKTKDEIDAIFKTYNITIENNVGYDYVYVYHMALADYYKSSLPTEKEVAQYVKDTIDDIDASDGAVFVAWYAKFCHSGIPVDWEELL